LKVITFLENPLKMKAVRILETSGTDYPAKQRNIQEERNEETNDRENLKAFRFVDI
jgi:hypothetical protein